VLAGNYSTGGVVKGVRILETNAFLYDPTQLFILDISNPTQPQLIGQTNITGITDLQVVRSNAFLACDIGLLIVDVSNRSNPVEVGRWEVSYSSGRALQVHVIGHIAYVTIDTDPGSTGGMTDAVLDVTNPAKPVLLKLPNPSPALLNGLSEFGHYLAAIDSSPSLKIYDNADPTNITLVTMVPLRNYPIALTMDGNYAYVAEGDAGVQVFDLSDPSRPLQFATLAITGNAVNTFVANNLVYVAGWDQGLEIWPTPSRFVLEIDAVAGVPFTIESATDLGSPNPWSTLLTTNSTRMPIWFTDGDVQTAAKFYRVRQ
jgi:hypothetical protein